MGFRVAWASCGRFKALHVRDGSLTAARCPSLKWFGLAAWFCDFLRAVCDGLCFFGLGAWAKGWRA